MNIQIESRDETPCAIGGQFIFLTHSSLRVGEELPVVFEQKIINVARVGEIISNSKNWKSKFSYRCVVIS